jgi:hypothetical protein
MEITLNTEWEEGLSWLPSFNWIIASKSECPMEFLSLNKVKSYSYHSDWDADLSFKEWDLPFWDWALGVHVAHDFFPSMSKHAQLTAWMHNTMQEKVPGTHMTHYLHRDLIPPPPGLNISPLPSLTISVPQKLPNKINHH